MKKLFTLGAALLLAGGAFAQEWEEVATTGWCHEYRDGSATQTDAEALMDGDAYKVYVRSLEEAKDNGFTGEKLDGWDSQFFIDFGEGNAVAAGDKVRVSFQIKADHAQTVSTQSQAKPGSYLHWYAIDNVNATDGWTSFSKEVSVAARKSDGNFDWGIIAEGTYSIAFNLTPADPADQVSNTFYFKDLKVEILKYNDPGVEPGIEIPDAPEGFDDLAVIPFVKNGEIVSVDQNFWTEESPKTVGAGGVVIGTSTVSWDIYADYTGYTEIILLCAKVADDAAGARAAASAEGTAFRFLYNRTEEQQNASQNNEKVAAADAEGIVRFDLSDLKEIHLNAIKLHWGQPETMVFGIYGTTVANGIADVKSVKAVSGCYDLQGRPVNQLHKGLYIVNGKKFIR